jgi:hypothetical protein
VVVVVVVVGGLKRVCTLRREGAGQGRQETFPYDQVYVERRAVLRGLIITVRLLQGQNNTSLCEISPLISL